MEAGQPYDLFWDATLYEVGLILDGVAKRVQRERNEAMSIAWHMAAFNRAKKMPRHRDVIADEPRPSGAKMTPEQLQAAVAGWLSKRKR